MFHIKKTALEKHESESIFISGRKIPQIYINKVIYVEQKLFSRSER